MLGIVKEISGQKQIIPLTTDAGTGAPVGTLIQQYKKKPMSGYLYCDGSTFDQNVYPALYMYLGSNVLPDYSNSAENGYVYIKATSGLAENQQDNVLKNVKDYVDNSNSYSTQEVKTGGTWIDGKPIYRKVVDFGALPNATTKNVAHGVSNIGDITHIYGVAHSSAKMTIPLPYARGIPIILYATQDDVAIEISTSDYVEFTRSEITIEYTKTTD